MVRAGVRQLGVEAYGGVLLNSWLDRDLGLSGRVAVRRNGTGAMVRLLRVDRPVCAIPQLAIHLDRDVSTAGLVVDAQHHLTPLWGIAPPKAAAPSPPPAPAASPASSPTSWGSTPPTCSAGT